MLEIKTSNDWKNTDLYLNLILIGRYRKNSFSFYEKESKEMYVVFEKDFFSILHNGELKTREGFAYIEGIFCIRKKGLNYGVYLKNIPEKSNDLYPYGMVKGLSY